MSGARWKCVQHSDFDLCFKCYWHYKVTHYPRFHDFEKRSEGTEYDPEYIDPPTIPHVSFEELESRSPTSPGKPTLSRQPTRDLTDHVADSEGDEDGSHRLVRIRTSSSRRRARLGLFRVSVTMNDAERSTISPTTEEEQRRSSFAQGDDVQKSASEAGD
jgi:hypothetical protein